MESPITTKDAPVDTFTPETTSEEVLRLEDGVCDMQGPVVVGGRYSSDCFRWNGELQAGVAKKDEPQMFEFKPDEPRKSPW